MLERMDEQMKTLSRAHKKELNNIEDAFCSERKDVLQAHKNKQSVSNYFLFVLFYHSTFLLFITMLDFKIDYYPFLYFSKNLEYQSF